MKDLRLDQVFRGPDKKVHVVAGLTPDGACLRQINPDKSMGDIKPVPAKELDSVIGKLSERTALVPPTDSQIICRGSEWTFKLEGSDESAPEQSHHQCLANLLVATEQVPAL